MGSYSINVFPNPLSKEEEADLLKKMQDGDKLARSKLIEHNLRLVAHIVKKYNGFLDIRHENKLFEVKCLLNI